MNKTLEDYINSLLEEEERKHLWKFVEELTPMVLNANKGMETQKPKTLYYENSYKQPSIYTSPNTPILQTAPKNLKTNAMISDLKKTLQNTSNKIFNQQKMIPNLLNNTSYSNSAVTKTSPLNQSDFNLTPIKNVNSANMENMANPLEFGLNNNKQYVNEKYGEPQKEPASTQKVSINKVFPQNSHENHTTSDSPNWIMPCEGRISSEYGWRIDPITEQKTWHNGWDIMADIGTPFKSIADGKVYFAGYGDPDGYAHFIIIDHGMINGNIVTSEYGHISEHFVTSGQIIRKGQIIGTTGNAGKSTGPHLHLTIREGAYRGVGISPDKYISH